MAAALATAGMGAGLAGGEPAAFAGMAETTCAYVQRGPPGPRGNYVDVRQLADYSVRVSRSGREIVFSSGGRRLNCAGPRPTVDNVDRLFLHSRGFRLLDLALHTGALGPGASERGRDAEIEIFVRTIDGPRPGHVRIRSGRAANVVTIGRAGGFEQINLNVRRERGRDSDVFIEKPGGRVIARLGGRADVFDGRGPGWLRPSTMQARIYGEAGSDRVFAPPRGGSQLSGADGDDLLVAGPRGDFLLGGEGRDDLIGGPAADLLVSGAGVDFVDAGPGDDSVNDYDDRVDRIDCGPGDDTAVVGGRDRLRRCEHVTRR